MCLDNLYSNNIITHCGPVRDYLGMSFDYSVNRTVKVGMIWYIGNAINRQPSINIPSDTKFAVKVTFQGMDTDTFGVLHGFQNGGA